jgi:hypothetical protein
MWRWRGWRRRRRGGAGGGGLGFLSRLPHEGDARERHPLCHVEIGDGEPATHTGGDFVWGWAGGEDGKNMRGNTRKGGDGRR